MAPETKHGDYMVTHHFPEGGQTDFPEVYAHLGGRNVGEVQLVPHIRRWREDDGPHQEHLGFNVFHVHVEPEHRRQGLASAMYQHAEIHLGKLFAGSVQTEDGAKFRASYESQFGRHLDPVEPRSLERSEGWMGLSKAEQLRFPFLVGAGAAPRFRFSFQLDPKSELHNRNSELNGRMLVHTGDGHEVGHMEFDHIPRNETMHLNYIGVHPEFRNQGLGETMLHRFGRWARHHRPGVKYLQSEQTNKKAFKFMNRVMGKPLLCCNDVKDHSVEEAMAKLPSEAPVDPDGKISTGNYFHAIHHFGAGRRPTVHPWNTVEKSLKADIREMVLAKFQTKPKNPGVDTGRLPMPFVRPGHHISWAIGAVDWRTQRMHVVHGDLGSGAPTGTGTVQLRAGMVLAQDGKHPISVANVGGR